MLQDDDWRIMLRTQNKRLFMATGQCSHQTSAVTTAIVAGYHGLAMSTVMMRSQKPYYSEQ